MKMMPTSTITPSKLTAGWHPGYLLTITEEATPADWVMAKQSPTLFKWWFATWEAPGGIGGQDPEVQSGITSTKFAPKGRFQASKAYTWACQLLQRQLPVGAGVDWDEYIPLPCRIKVSREAGKDYIKIEDVEAWPDGTQALSTVKELLQQLRTEIETTAPPVPEQMTTPPATHGHAQPPAPQPQAPAPAPGMQTWGSQSAQPALSGGRPQF
jgi:hypothetical protein